MQPRARFRRPPTDAVVFDLGGVLLDWDPRYLYRKLFDDDAQMEAFLSDVCTLEWHAAHDRGVPLKQSCAALAAAHPQAAELIRAWGERSEEMLAGPIDGTVAILAELLQAGVRCYALTNMERETYPLRRVRYPFLGWFAGTVVSSDEGVAKPDPEIFRRLLTRFELDPARTVMIDDSIANLQTAGSLGMTPVRFTSPFALRAALQRLRLLPIRATGQGTSIAPMTHSTELRTKLIEGIQELETDLTRLRAALSALDGHASTTSSSPSSPSSSTPPKPVVPPSTPRRRSRRRSQQTDVVPAGKIQTLLGKTGGITTAELARETNGGHEQILSILKELEQSGKAYRSGTRRSTRWHGGRGSSSASSNGSEAAAKPAGSVA